MRKLIVHQFITLDGVIQAPGEAVEDIDDGFPYGGWSHPYWHDDIGAHFGQAFAEADSILLGRKTWQIHGNAFGPHPDQDPFAGMQKYVVSNTLQSVEAWPGSFLIRGDAVEAVRQLKAQPGKNIIMDGSSVL
ncbi:MAG: dihydrofolate reductase family protein, partial [Chloroflexi bacterium]|nr:dihydrofolate reductase family protein [Chloroflexota bacterium]